MDQASTLGAWAARRTAAHPHRLGGEAYACVRMPLGADLLIRSLQGPRPVRRDPSLTMLQSCSVGQTQSPTGRMTTGRMEATNPTVVHRITESTGLALWSRSSP